MPITLSGASGVTFNDSTNQSTAPTQIGVGQTWQVVTGSRAINTNYTNSTGKPIMVAINFNTGTSGLILVNGVFAGIGASTAGQATGGVTTIVPNGAVYNYAGGAAVLEWSELR